MSKDKKLAIYYVDNVKFYEVLKEHIYKYRAAKEADIELPKIPEYIGLCIYNIANKLANHAYFSKWSFRDEMISDGIETSIKYLHNFNPDKYKNAFAYITQIIKFAFLQRIQKERKEQYIKSKSLEMAIIHNDLSSFQNNDGSNLASNTSLFDYTEKVVSEFEASMAKKTSTEPKQTNSFFKRRGT